MGHIVIQNKGELPLFGMRLLGYSDKDETKIGRFGTGLKESIALLARMGSLPVFFTGSCRIDFCIETTDDIEEIMFRLSEDRPRFKAGEWHSLGIHPGFGKADWQDPWMVFREVICNAIDECGKEFVYHDVTSGEMSGVPGSTRVYIPATTELVESYSSIENKILMLGNPEVVEDIPQCVRILEKSEGAGVRVYSKGIFVQQSDKDRFVSVYDYDFSNIRLNESRSADWFSVESEVWIAIKAMSSISLMRIFEKIMSSEKKDRVCIELGVIDSVGVYLSDPEPLGRWKEAFYRLRGEDCVIVRNDRFAYERAKEHGIDATPIYSDGLYTVLERAGVKTVTKMLSKAVVEYQSVSDPDDRMSRLFNSVWMWFESLSMNRGKPKPDLKSFVEHPGKEDIVFGSYADGVCYINAAYPITSHEIVAMVEEIAHYVTEHGDMTRGFQTFLVTMIGRVYALQSESVMSLPEDD